MEREYVETKIFSAGWKQLGQSEEELRLLQNFLTKQPELGVVIQGTGGLRKLRWARERAQSGKRGGLRVIYLDVPTKERIFLILVYGKNEKEDLGEMEKRELSHLARVLLDL